MNYLWVAIGSALGGVARYWCSGLVARLAGETFPWGTILVNILGSFFIGFAAALSRPEGRFLIPFEARLFVMVGLCGGYTTFSSFSLQTLTLLQDGQRWAAVGNVTVSVVLCLLSVWLGFAAAMLFNRWKSPPGGGVGGGDAGLGASPCVLPDKGILTRSVG